MDSQSKLVKILLCFWIFNITWAVYRIGRAIPKQNWTHVALGVLWVLASLTIGWILDIIWIALYDRIFWFQED